MNHFDLCKATAKRYFRKLKADVALWEYKSFVSSEEPDVLVFKGGYTSIFEIKVSRTDFLKDKKKDCRVKYRMMNYHLRSVKINDEDRVNIRTQSTYPGALKQFYTEAPHLGGRRFYVCPKGLIDPKEIPEGWGLIWFHKGRFYEKVMSSHFRRNIHAEMRLLSHAFRKKVGLGECNIIVNSFKPQEVE